MIATYLHRNYVIHHAQHEIRAGSLCLANLLTHVDNVSYLLDTSEQFGLCFFYYSKDFDVFKHCVVCAKLECLCAPKIVTSMTFIPATIYL